MGSMTRSLTHSPLSLLPISFGSGFLGNSLSMIANAVAGGTVVLGGIVLSSAIVDYTVGKSIAAPTTFKEKWARPIAFAAISGLVGSAVAWIGGALKFRNKGLVAALAASGPGFLSLAGIIKATLADKTADTGIVGDIARFGNLGDFLQARQLADYFQAPQGMSGCDPDFDLDDSTEGGDANAMADAGLDDESGDGFDVM